MHFEFKGHVRDAGFDSRLGNKGLFNTIGGPMKGVHALSRSMTYYHRPGNWKEQPNMFNPYWRAKLAPISHSFMTALAKVGLSPGGGMAKFLEEFITH